MTGAIVGLAAVYCLVIYAGKHIRRHGPGSIIFLFLMAALQVAAALYFVYTIKTPVNS